MKKTHIYREPVGFAFKYVLAIKKWLAWIIIFFAICPLLVVVIGLYPIIIQSSGSTFILFTDPTISGLVGVLIGGTISGLTSYYLHLEQLKADALLMKRETVYKPLYEALVEFKNQVTHIPYSWPINVEVGENYGETTFTLWNQFKQEANYLETSKWLARALDKFILDIRQYNKDCWSASKMLEEKLIKLMKDEGYLSEAHGFGALTRILQGQYDISNSPFGYTKFINAEAAQKFNTWDELPLIYKGFGEVEDIRNLRVHYKQNIIDHTDWLIKELSRVILFINNKYGSQSPLV
jgi:hypothetical protein